MSAQKCERQRPASGGVEGLSAPRVYVARECCQNRRARNYEDTVRGRSDLAATAVRHFWVQYIRTRFVSPKVVPLSC